MSRRTFRIVLLVLAGVGSLIHLTAFSGPGRGGVMRLVTSTLVLACWAAVVIVTVTDPARKR